jgi:hypothetical protein
MDWASGARHLLREYAQQEPGTTRDGERDGNYRLAREQDHP